MVSGGRPPPFLTSALDGGEWSASRRGGFISVERVPGNHWIGGWVGPSSGIDDAGKRKTTCICRESNSGNPAHSMLSKECVGCSYICNHTVEEQCYTLQ
jgi:hypothetical protein